MRLRNAVFEDAAAIATVHVRSWKSAYPGLVPQTFLDALTPKARLASWQGILASPAAPGAGTVVLVDEDAVVGFVNFGPVPDDDGSTVGEVTTLYLDPEIWGRGHGAELLDAAIGEFRTAGFRSARLWVLGTNARARRFYEKLGWRADGATKLHDWKAFVATDVRYRLELTRSAP